MEIIDCQVHPPFDVAAWTPGMDDETRNLITSHLVEADMRAVGVDRALVNWTPALNQSAYEAFQGKFRSISVIEPPGAHGRETVLKTFPGFPEDVVISFKDDDALRSTIMDLRTRAGLVSLRIECGFMPGQDTIQDLEMLMAGGHDPIFEAGRDLDLPVCIWIAGALDSLSTIVERFPDVWVVVDHLGLVPRAFMDSTLDDLPLLLALARYPKVAVKISGAVDLSKEPYPFRDVWPVIRQVVNEFGAERVMWGSDYTMHPGHSYAEALGFLLHSEVLTDEEKEMVFGGSLRRIFNWPKNG